MPRKWRTSGTPIGWPTSSFIPSPMRKNRIWWIQVRRSEDGIREFEVGIEGWCRYEKWIWKPEDGARNFQEYLEYLAPRKDYIYERVNENLITLVRGTEIVSVNVSGGYVEYSDGRRIYGTQFWLRLRRNARKKWKKRRGTSGGQKQE